MTVLKGDHEITFEALMSNLSFRGERVPYCWKCGTEMKEDANFCPKCGAPASERARRKRRHAEWWE